uniref:Uncharacterized protein n=1 Tax=Candidatus Kentrum sp. LPFa TaxID=2126335 RepID=A0A450Y151_9GAMM|nr:MAG: hypothetical protein BECKLPF1236A_GA0070988_103513 [Candidatus Kentron sp. LPFa]VFK35259.1 MAG: hypothetical protein BECKLPF1236C_GA0070990_103523 [Candidatus Kentron sp. LPFa]
MQIFITLFCDIGMCRYCSRECSLLRRLSPVAFARIFSSKYTHRKKKDSEKLGLEIKASPPSQSWREALHVLESHELVSSLGILAELERILRKKFTIPASQIEKILAFLRFNSRLSEPHEKKSYRITDTGDMPYLSAAENAQCDALLPVTKNYTP